MLAKAEVIKKADELNRMAAKLLPLPEGLTQAEQLLYKSLCIVYREFRAGQIDKKQALDEKQEQGIAQTIQGIHQWGLCT